MTKSDIATRVESGPTRTWEWALLTEIELLEELLVEYRRFIEADDAQAGHEIPLALALRRRRHDWRTAG